jgi:hypothetical protein
MRGKRPTRGVPLGKEARKKLAEDLEAHTGRKIRLPEEPREPKKPKPHPYSCDAPDLPDEPEGQIEADEQIEPSAPESKEQPQSDAMPEINLGAVDAPDAPSAIVDEDNGRIDLRKLPLAERRIMALNMRVAGNSYRDIARELGMGVKETYNSLMNALTYLAKYEKIVAEDVRLLELNRCDALTAYLWPHCERGDPIAVQAQLKVMERRAMMLGLNAPQQIDINIRPLRRMSPEDLQELVGRLKQQAGVGGANPRPALGPPVIDLSTIPEAAYPKEGWPKGKPRKPRPNTNGSGDNGGGDNGSGNI